MKLMKTILLSMMCLCLAGAGFADEITPIRLADHASSCEGSQVVIDGDTITITAPGEYLLSGALTDGQIRVDCKDDGKVILYLDGVTIHNEDGAALYIGRVSPRLRISLNAGSENTFTNGSSLIYDIDDEPNGVIFSRSDLTILGEGQLKVLSGAMDGIVSKDDLRVENGNIEVDAARHGIKGKDSIEISGGKITIRAGRDGLKSTNDKDPDRGYIDITGGEIEITCGDDPIAYTTTMNVTGATLAFAVESLYN